MAFNAYSYWRSKSKLTYGFDSAGPNGIIVKQVHFRPRLEGRLILFDVAFGDTVEASDTIDDVMRSNNHDRDVILETLANIVLDFFDHFPTATIQAVGSTPARTRLYQMSIARNLQVIVPLVAVWGRVGGNWETFQTNKNYSAFRAQRKWIPSNVRIKDSSKT